MAESINDPGPKIATVDGMTAQAHDLPDQIAADQYLAAKAAARKKHRGIRITRLILPPQVPTSAAGFDNNPGSYA